MKEENERRGDESASRSLTDFRDRAIMYMT